MGKEESLAKLGESRRALRRAIEGLSEQEMTQVHVEGVWTVKDVISHIASWDETLLDPLRRCSAGGGFEVQVIEDYLAWNDEQAARKRDIPLDAMLEESATVRRELVALAKGVPDEWWERQLTFPWGDTGTLAHALSGLAWHEMEHVRTIQRWRDGGETEAPG